MYAVTELQRIGFDVWLDSGKIRYKQVTEGPPVNAEWVNNLLQNIREHKKEVIDYLQNPQPQKEDPPSPADTRATDGQADQVKPCQDAELFSSSLQYLAGIGEHDRDGVDFTGWTLWRRIEQGREHRFALDASGKMRWNRPGPENKIDVIYA